MREGKYVCLSLKSCVAAGGRRARLPVACLYVIKEGWVIWLVLIYSGKKRSAMGSSGFSNVSATSFQTIRLVPNEAEW